MRVETREVLHSNQTTIKGPDFGLGSSQVLAAGEKKEFSSGISEEMIRFSRIIAPFLDEYNFTKFHIRSRFAQAGITGALPNSKDFIRLLAGAGKTDELVPRVRLQNVGNAPVRIEVPCMSIWASRSEFLTGEALERQVRDQNIQITGNNWEYFFDETDTPVGIRFFLDPHERYTIIPHREPITHKGNGYHHGRDVIKNHIMKIPYEKKTPFLLAQTADRITFSENVHGVIQAVGSRERVFSDDEALHVESRMIEGGNTRGHELKIEVQVKQPVIVDTVNLQILPK